MIELSRYLAIGQFFDTQSVIHQLDARTKLVCGLILIILFSLMSSFLAFFSALLFVCLLIVLARLSFQFIGSSLKPAAIFIAIVFVFQVFFFQSSSHAIIFWQWHFLSISNEGIITSLVADLRALFLYFIVILLTLTTSLMDIADATESILRPLQKLQIPVHELTMVLIIALKFIPLFVRQIENIMKARITRGIQKESKNIFINTYSVSSLLVPLFIQGFRRGELLAVAMEARCYKGGENRTKLKTLTFHMPDYVAFVVVILFMIAIIIVR